MVLIKEELGNECLTKDYFSIGASSLLDNIKNEILDLSSGLNTTNQNKTDSAPETKPEKAKST